MDELVTIRTFLYAHEAAIVRSVLEAEGIYCFLKDEYTIQVNPLYSNALGGVKLQVLPGDVPRSNQILEENGYSLAPSEEKTIEVANDTDQISTCPACQSTDVSLTKRPSGLFYGLSIMLLGFPLPVFKTQYHCYNCGKDIIVRINKRTQ